MFTLYGIVRGVVCLMLVIDSNYQVIQQPMKSKENYSTVCVYGRIRNSKKHGIL